MEKILVSLAERRGNENLSEKMGNRQTKKKMKGRRKGEEGRKWEREKGKREDKK